MIIYCISEEEREQKEGQRKLGLRQSEKIQLSDLTMEELLGCCSHGKNELHQAWT